MVKIKRSKPSDCAGCLGWVGRGSFAGGAGDISRCQIIDTVARKLHAGLVEEPRNQADASPARPVLVSYAASLAPYELHFYRRVARELPVELEVLVPRRDSSRDWQFESADGLEFIDLSNGDRDTGMMSIAAQFREWCRGRQVIERLRSRNAACFLLSGYNDLGRLHSAWWAKRRGRAVLMRADSNLADESGKSRLRIAIKRAFLSVVRRLVDYMLVVGPRGVEYWEHYGHPSSKTILVPYEPDYELIESVSDAEVGEAVERFGVDPARRRIVFSGRLAPIKRVDLLIDAFAAIAEARPEWDLLLLGDGELRDTLADSVPSHLRERVTWAGFLADQRDVSRLYRASDVLVLPSEYEPWAVVVNEAAAAGLALVTSDIVGASPALVHDGVNGETFPSGDLPGLIDALSRVTNPAEIDRYKKASHGVLQAWRTTNDPVEGLREALVRTGVIS